MLPKPHRLPAAQIRSVMRRGRRVHAAGVTLFYEILDPRLRGDEENRGGDEENRGGDDENRASRFAVVVPTSVVKKAVVRNRIRRLVRESVRLALPGVSGGWDGVFLIRKGLGDEFAVVDHFVRELLRRAGILNESKIT